MTRFHAAPNAGIDYPYIEDLSFLDYADAELVIGLVSPVGTDFEPVREALGSALTHFEYSTKFIRLSSFLDRFEFPLEDSPEHRRIETRMDAGNALCRETGSKELLAMAAVFEVLVGRGDSHSDPAPSKRTAHILVSLKRPEEVSLLRKVYGCGFFSIGVYSSESDRLKHLIDKNSPRNEALRLMQREEKEEDPFGQQTRDTFALADVFVNANGLECEREMERFLKLVFSHPYTTPSPDEYPMFLAYAASLRSAQLGRQVGASIVSETGDVISVGCNDVPKSGGGLYWPGSGDKRDHRLGKDFNDEHVEMIRMGIAGKLGNLVAEEQIPSGRELLKGVVEITEFGRSTHAEMEALLCCARSGISVRNATLYATTFPCHNCARHIITSGIKRVVFVEPYAKSRAEYLHWDSIDVKGSIPITRRAPANRIPFEPFVGVGPRRFFDLFSLTLSSGYRLNRKLGGRTVRWHAPSAVPRIPMQPVSYLRREQIAARQFRDILKQLEAM